MVGANRAEWNEPILITKCTNGLTDLRRPASLRAGLIRSTAKDAADYPSLTRRYPTPLSVRKWRGRTGSASSLSRNCFM